MYFDLYSKGSLLRHAKSHDGHRVTCDICRRIFGRINVLTRHYKNVHIMYFK